MAKNADDQLKPAKPKKSKVKTANKVLDGTPDFVVKNLGGRPTDYCLENAQKICRIIATCTLPLQKMCDTYDFFPKSKSSIYEWRYDHKVFADMYALAKQQQAELLAEDITEISDDGTNDWMLSNAKDNPGWVLNGEHVQRSRLRVDTRKWIACKLLPKVYGEKAEPPKDDNNQNITIVAEALELIKAKHAKDY